MYIYSVTGTVGCGKSTLIERVVQRYMEKHPPYELVTEPENLAQWRDDQGHDWLKGFYANKRYFNTDHTMPSSRLICMCPRTGFAFQMMVLKTQVETYQRNLRLSNTSKVPVVLLSERSPEDGRDIFIHLLVDQGHVTDAERRLFSWWSDNFAWKADKTFWIDVEPSECIRRISLRNRDCETSCDSAYFEKLTARYREVFDKRQDVVKLDNSGTLEVLDQLADSILDTIMLDIRQHDA